MMAARCWRLPPDGRSARSASSSKSVERPRAAPARLEEPALAQYPHGEPVQRPATQLVGTRRSDSDELAMEIGGGDARERHRQDVAGIDAVLEQPRDAPLHGEGLPGAGTGDDADARIRGRGDLVGDVARVESVVPGHRALLVAPDAHVLCATSPVHPLDLLSPAAQGPGLGQGIVL